MSTRTSTTPIKWATTAGQVLVPWSLFFCSSTFLFAVFPIFISLWSLLAENVSSSLIVLLSHRSKLWLRDSLIHLFWEKLFVCCLLSSSMMVMTVKSNCNANIYVLLLKLLHWRSNSCSWLTLTCCCCERKGGRGEKRGREGRKEGCSLLLLLH